MDTPNVDNKGVLALKRLLQRFFKKLVTGIPQLEVAETNCKKQVASLANLLEQYESTVKLDSRGMTIVTLFPDIQTSLLVKISQEVDAKVTILQQHMTPFKELQEGAYKARTDALKLCKTYNSCLNAHDFIMGEPSIPPVAAMLNWLDDIEKQLRQYYCCRVFYLNNILDEEIINSNNLTTLWTEHSKQLFNTIKECEEKTVFFLDTKL
ncbi:uncharacterized protein LOC131951304 [Physella acuta]|uniref:uncharacterized protein LOC131951304 n=1 Tax=Physella acuta TaxID=109671 RepID=UPI0027DC4DEC|nr:uncharacterized protein LOC131951304 [Physella acuta]